MSYKILHIDDDELIREVTSMLLEMELKLRPGAVNTNPRAEHLLQVTNGEYDLIICDNDTKSQIKGLDALVEARKKGLETPIIIYAALYNYPTDRHAREEIERRGGLFVPKPNHMQLVNMTRSIMNSSTNIRTSYDLSRIPDGLDYQI